MVWQRERSRSGRLSEPTSRLPVGSSGLVALLVALAAGACSPAEPVAIVTSTATVERVVDGDTVDVTIGDHRERVRLIGVDAPESVARSVPEQCFGAEASEALRSLLPVGTVVAISRDEEARDRYGRLLLYLSRADDGLFVNLWLVETGHAEAVSYEPNTTHEPGFDRARRRAVTDAVGLWAQCDGPDQPLR